MYAAQPHSSEGKVTGEKGPVTELKPGTYALMWSISHASHRNRSQFLVSHHLCVLVCPQLRPLKTHALKLALVGCNDNLLSAWAISVLHTQACYTWNQVLFYTLKTVYIYTSCVSL